MSMVTKVSAASLPQEQFVVLIARHERRIRSFIAGLVFCDRDAIDEVIQSTYRCCGESSTRSRMWNMRTG